MALKFAFMGFRHGHILDLYNRVKQSPDLELVAACEEDVVGAKGVVDSVTVTYNDYAAMLDEVECDVVAIGDYYGKRGAIAIEALRRGKHVMADKPICTDLGELDQIEKLATEKGLSVGCQLDLIHSKYVLALKQLIDAGRLGELHQIHIGGQHPLSYGTRPMWYFEPGKHGGTINDIAIHAFHALPWLTGQDLTEVVAARTWNAFAVEQPSFPDSAQAMIKMSNGCGLMLDVSYAMPSALPYGMPQYWRITAFGSRGVAEASITTDHVWFAELGKDEPQVIDIADIESGSYLDDYLAEIAGNPCPPITTGEIIAASRKSLLIQQAADTGQRDVKL